MDPNAPVKHVASMYSIFNFLEKQEFQDLEVQNTCASQSSVPDTMEDAKVHCSSSSAHQSACPSKALKTSKPSTTVESLCQQPELCTNGYTAEAMISESVRRDSVNAKPTVTEPSNLADQRLPPKSIGSFQCQGGYVEDTTRLAPSANIAMSAQATVALSNKTCHIQSLPASSQDSRVGYATDEAAMFGLPSHVQCVASPREHDGHGGYTTESAILSLTKQQSTATSYPHTPNGRFETGQLCPLENLHIHRPQLLPPSVFTVPLNGANQATLFNYGTSGSGGDPAPQQTTQRSALDSRYISEASNMSQGIGTIAPVGNLSNINTATTSSPPLPQECFPGTFHGEPSTTRKADGYTQKPHYNPQERTQDKAPPQLTLSYNSPECGSPCTKPQEQSPLDHVGGSSSAKHPSNTMGSDYLPECHHARIVADTTEACKGVSLKDHFTASEKESAHSVLPLMLPADKIQVRERMPFTVALMHPKLTQKEYDTSSSESENSSTSTRKLATPNLHTNSQTSSISGGYNSLENLSCLASPISVFSEEDSSSMSQPDVDPPSVFPLPSSSEQEYSTSGYVSSSLSYSISEAAEFATHVPPHHRRDSGRTTHSDTQAGYTTHSEVPSSTISHERQLIGSPALSRDYGYVSDSLASSLQCKDSRFWVVQCGSIEDTEFVALQSLDSPLSLESLPFTDEH